MDLYFWRTIMSVVKKADGHKAYLIEAIRQLNRADWAFYNQFTVSQLEQYYRRLVSVAKGKVVDGFPYSIPP
jgi:hypothetical protein